MDSRLRGNDGFNYLWHPQKPERIVRNQSTRRKRNGKTEFTNSK